MTPRASPRIQASVAGSHGHSGVVERRRRGEALSGRVVRRGVVVGLREEIGLLVARAALLRTVAARCGRSRGRRAVSFAFRRERALRTRDDARMEGGTPAEKRHERHPEKVQ
jgi:hypothetical protein